MSRIGKKPILIPEGVDVKIEDNKVVVKGPRGELSKEIRPEIKIAIEGNKIVIKPNKETKQTRALWGLFRAILYNTIKGVTEGYERKLEIEGVGYRANLDGQDLVLQVGFSHPVKIRALEGIKFSIEKNIVIVSGIDKELVGEMAAKIRRVKPPEPYKGKGIRYAGEVVRRKLGKKAVATTT